MRRIYIIAILSTAVVFCADKNASKGAVTEGLFILRNKSLSVKKTIQDLKKELTQCHVTPDQKMSEIERYHCLLRQLVYPPYIDELSTLIAYTEADINFIAQEAPIGQVEFDARMKRAFLLREKIDLEKKYLASLFCVDTEELECARLKELVSKKPDDKKAALAHTTLQKTVKKHKAECARLTSRLNEVHTKLFIGELMQSIFLESLTFYST